MLMSSDRASVSCELQTWRLDWNCRLYQWPDRVQIIQRHMRSFLQEEAASRGSITLSSISTKFWAKNHMPSADLARYVCLDYACPSSRLEVAITLQYQQWLQSGEQWYGLYHADLVAMTTLCAREEQILSWLTWLRHNTGVIECLWAATRHLAKRDGQADKKLSIGRKGFTGLRGHRAWAYLNWHHACWC